MEFSYRDMANNMSDTIWSFNIQEKLKAKKKKEKKKINE